jgi:hypothetical protein
LYLIRYEFVGRKNHVWEIGCSRDTESAKKRCEASASEAKKGHRGAALCHFWGCSGDVRGIEQQIAKWLRKNRDPTKFHGKRTGKDLESVWVAPNDDSPSKYVDGVCAKNGLIYEDYMELQVP